MKTDEEILKEVLNIPIKESILGNIWSTVDVVKKAIALTRENCEKFYENPEKRDFTRLEQRAWDLGIKMGQKAERERILEKMK